MPTYEVTVTLGAIEITTRETAADWCVAATRAMARLCPGDTLPDHSVVSVHRLPDDAACEDNFDAHHPAACVRCAGRGHDYGRVCECHAGDEYREVRP